MVLLAAFVVLLPAASFAEDTLPDRISNQQFRSWIETLSEPGGSFQFENLLSNETDFPYVMSSLRETVLPGGVYLGVGPEQNFNYIAAIRPKIAFIIDIRRENMLEHLMYKALFAMSPDRASFVSRLFSRTVPAGLSSDMTAAELFDAFSEVTADDSLLQKNWKELQAVLAERRLALSREDRAVIEQIYSSFAEFGPMINYNSRGGSFGGPGFIPTYAELMTATDNEGMEWSYLSSEARYLAVRDLENRNLIVPITGDFGGPKALRSVGQYLTEHGAVVSAFYTSNVEGYLIQGGDRQGNPNGGAERFYANVEAMPLDVSSTFIRWVPGVSRSYGTVSVFLAPIQTSLDDFNAGRLTLGDSFAVRNPGFGRRPNRGFFNNGGGRRGFAAQSAVWVERLKVLFYALWAACGFVIRYAFWRPASVEGFLAPRRIAHSLLWGMGGLVIAVGLGLLSGI